MINLQIYLEEEAGNENNNNQYIAILNPNVTVYTAHDIICTIGITYNNQVVQYANQIR